MHLASPCPPDVEEPCSRTLQHSDGHDTPPARLDMVGADERLTEDRRGSLRRQAGSHEVWTPWRRLGGILTSRPAVVVNDDGRLEVFARGADRRMHHIWQTAPNGRWAGTWAAPPGEPASAGDPGQSVAVAGQAEGRLDVFAQLGDGAAFLGAPVLARSADGRFVIFARDRRGVMHHISEIAPDLWHDTWQAIAGGAVTGDAAAALTGDGQLAIFACSPHRELVHAWETAPGGSFTAWSSLGGSLDHASTPAVARNAHGELQVFVRWQDGSTRHRRLLPGREGQWADWQTLNGVARTDPVVAANADGRLAVFVVGADGALYVSEQTTTG
jgi:hypothetical protein